MNLEQMGKYITPTNYTIGMAILLALQMYLLSIEVTAIGLINTGFVVGLWLGNWMRWIIVK